MPSQFLQSPRVSTFGRRGNSLARHAVNGITPDFVFDPVEGFYYKAGSRRTIDEVASWDGVPITDMGALRTHGNDPTLYMLMEELNLTSGFNISVEGYWTHADAGLTSQMAVYDMNAAGGNVRTIMATYGGHVGKPWTRSYDGSTQTAVFAASDVAVGTDVPFAIAARHTATEQQVALDGVAGAVASGGGLPAYVDGAEMDMAVGWIPEAAPSDEYFVCTRVRIWEGDPLGSANLADAAVFRDVPNWTKPEKKYIIMYGDSLTQTGYQNTLHRLAPSHIVVNLGLGSQGSRHIATRMGAVTADLTVSGNEIVSGANTITHINGYALAPGLGNDGGDGTLNYEVNQFLSRGDSSQSVSLTGTLGGVHGTLARSVGGSGVVGTDPEVYTFTPDAGETLPVSLGGDATWQTDDLYRGQGNIIIPWVGANDLGFGEIDQRFKPYAAAIATWLAGETYLWIGPHTRTGDGEDAWWQGGWVYNEFVAERDYILTLIDEDDFLDMNDFLVNEVLDLLGLTPTAQDLIDISRDTPPSQIKDDIIHNNALGNEGIGLKVYERISGLL